MRVGKFGEILVAMPEPENARAPRITGYEDWSASEIEDRLSGDDVPMDDLRGVHGCLRLLCKRVSELDATVHHLEMEIAELETVR